MGNVRAQCCAVRVMTHPEVPPNVAEGPPSLFSALGFHCRTAERKRERTKHPSGNIRDNTQTLVCLFTKQEQYTVV